MNLEATD